MTFDLRFTDDQAEIELITVVTREYRHGCKIQIVRIDYVSDDTLGLAESDHQADIWLPDGTAAWSELFETDSWELALNEAYEWLRWNSPHEYRYEPQYWLTTEATSLINRPARRALGE